MLLCSYAMRRLVQVISSSYHQLRRIIVYYPTPFTNSGDQLSNIRLCVGCGIPTSSQLSNIFLILPKYTIIIHDLLCNYYTLERMHVHLKHLQCYHGLIIFAILGLSNFQPVEIFNGRILLLKLLISQHVSRELTRFVFEILNTSRTTEILRKNAHVKKQGHISSHILFYFVSNIFVCIGPKNQGA